MRFAVKLLRQIGLFRSAHTGAVGASALRHETVDHAVEFDVVVKAFLGQFDDAGNVIRGKVGAQLNNHVAGCQVQGQRFGHG